METGKRNQAWQLVTQHLPAVLEGKGVVEFDGLHGLQDVVRRVAPVGHVGKVLVELVQ